MKGKENVESHAGQKVPTDRKTVWKQLGIFLVICLPVTWLLMGMGYEEMTSDGFEPWANFLVTFACFMPAIAAVLASLITKESLWKLQFMPRLRGHVKVYFIAIAIGIVISCADLLLMSILFPRKVSFHEDVTAVIIIFSMLYVIALSCVQFFVGMGEELGWMGYLFPRLEKLCGTAVALIATGVIRGLWHLVMFMQGEDFLVGLLSLCVSNILLGSVLVWATKAGKSVIPASVIHVMTNALPGALAAYMVMDESLYDSGFSGMDVFSMLPALIMGVVCYIILIKKYKVEKL